MSRWRRAAQTALQLAVVPTLLGGCGDDSATPPGATTAKSAAEKIVESYRDADAVSASQAAALEDGEVTFEEYEQAVLDFQECATNSDVLLEGFRLNSATQLYEWGVRAEDPTVVDPCYNDKLVLVDMLWQASVADSGGSQAAVHSEAVRQCLTENGVRFEQEMSLPELLQLADANELTCL